MVLYRRAAEGQAMRAAQQAHRFGRGGGGVLDGLRLIQHDVVEFHFRELGGVAQHGAVGGQHQIVLADQRRVARQARCAPARGSWGVKRCASARQLNINDFGATTSEGP
jgi:hypothetical protein